jgi:hypothetical protein
LARRGNLSRKVCFHTVGASFNDFSLAKKSHETCSVCSRGFQLRRLPPLHLSCTGCGKLTHTRCVKKVNRSLSSFVCLKCKPDPDQSHPSTSEPTPSCPTAALESSTSVTSLSASVAAISTSVTSSAASIGRVNALAKVCSSGPSSARNASQTLEESEILLLEPEETFDARMQFLGFKRSPSQPNTIGDGACGVRALCDQLHLSCSDPMFGPDEHVLARRCTATTAKTMVKKKELDNCFFEPNVSEWCTRMSKNSEFIDNIFLYVFAQTQERDIVVIPVHRESAAGSESPGNGDFRWIKGIFLTSMIALGANKMHYLLQVD